MWCSVWVTSEEEGVQRLGEKNGPSPRRRSNCNITPFLHLSPRLNLGLWVALQKQEVCQIGGVGEIWSGNARIRVEKCLGHRFSRLDETWVGWRRVLALERGWG